MVVLFVRTQFSYTFANSTVSSKPLFPLLCLLNETFEIITHDELQEIEEICRSELIELDIQKPTILVDCS